jgi:hypothetical protein
MKQSVTRNFLTKIGLLFVLAGIYNAPAFGQATAVKFEDFNRANNSVVDLPSSGGTQAWLETESASSNNYRVRIENNMLALGSFNNLTPAAGSAATEQVSFDVTNRYATIFNQAASNVTWHFNFRQSRISPSGFGTGFYGVAYVLGSTEANFTSANASGYAVVIGNANSPDPVKLVHFTGGLNANSNLTTIITSTEENATTYYSVKVTYNPCSKDWSLQVRNDGAAFADPLTISTAALTAKDQVFTNSNLNFMGAAFSHGTANEKAYFDNLYLPDAPVAAPVTYTWTGAVSTDFENANNWNPARICNRLTDNLTFTGGNAISLTNVTSLDFAKLQVADNTLLTLKGKAGATQTLNINGGNGEDLSIGTGAALIMDSNDPVELVLKTGTTGRIFGQVTFQNTEANLGRAHRLLVADANGLVFENGSQFIAKNLNGEAFGNSGAANTVIFKANAIYISRDGASPFGLASPASKVVFETGSLYRHEQVGTAPKFDGRVYADFELNVTNALAIIFGTSAPTPTRIDNFTISSGTMNITLASGSLPLPLQIRGNLTVAPAAFLNFNPSLAQNTSIIAFNGTTAQQISGPVYFGPNSGLEINNPAGLEIRTALTINGSVQFTNGIVTVNPGNSLTIADNATVTGASANSYVSGKVLKTGNEAFTFPIGKCGFYAPLSISAPLNSTDQYAAEYFLADPTKVFGNSKADSLSSVSTKEYWDLERVTGNSEVQVSLSYDPARSALIGDPQTLRIAHFSNNTSWKNEGRTNGSGTQNLAVYGTSNPQTSFSPFTFGAVGSNGPLPVELVNFSANSQQETVVLNWITATEKNNDRFEIERSRDGRSFQKIGEVKGQGTSTSSNRYAFGDKNPYSGTAYYRLKQVDFDGTVTYSKVVAVSNAFKKQTVKLFPNPVQDALTVVIPGNETTGSLQILDLSGRVLKSVAVNKDGGDLKINVSDLNPGAYLLKTNEGQPAVKFLKVN